VAHPLELVQNPFEKIFDLADDAIISTDDSQRIILFNQGAERIFGYSAREARGQRLDILIPATSIQEHREYFEGFAASNLVARRMSERSPIRGRRKDGREFPAEASISKVEVGGRLVFTVILRDVTERKAYEARIEASLREKETLLKEIHHRVKNNLQVVSSLIGLQARTVTDTETRRMFLESQNRIQSMALLHESLYSSENLSRIDFPAYIRELAAYLFRSHGFITPRVRLFTDLDELILDLDTAVPCGLIANELISNSLKYAFSDEREGEIHVTLRVQTDQSVVFVFSDNGVGLPEEIDWTTTPTLGLRLVRTLARQLGAKLEIASKPGTIVQLTLAAGA